MSEIIRIENIEGNLRVSSRLIAEHFEKRHDSVLRDIENLISNIGSPQNCGSLHEEDIDEKSVDLFKKSTYQHPQNKQWYKEYLINRDGFTLLAMGFTGKKALEWKLKYIEAFNKMEEELRKNNEYTKSSLISSCFFSLQKLFVGQNHFRDIVVELIILHLFHLC